MTTVHETHYIVTGPVLYMALELSNKTWKLGFSNGSKVRQVNITAGDWPALTEAVKHGKEKLKLPATCPVYSCYEAGRDGFWIHRALVESGLKSLVVDSSSIEVNRRQRRAKSDGVDVKALLRLLQRYLGGEHEVLRVVRVPSVEEEDRRRLHRERERLLKERIAHRARLQSLLVTHGIRDSVGRGFLERLESFRGGLGYAVGEDLKAELRREYERYCLVCEQLKGLEAEQQRRVEIAEAGALKQVQQLMLLRGVGWQSSWKLVMEFFAWRAFANRRELGACAGLTPTPYDSGESQREQGISKAGNRRVRSLMVELSWLWLRYQPRSALSLWFNRRFGQGGKRMRRIGIVALARKLLVALWRYLRDGVIPVGATLSV